MCMPFQRFFSLGSPVVLLVALGLSGCGSSGGPPVVSIDTATTTPTVTIVDTVPPPPLPLPTDTTPPVISILSPANGFSTNKASLTVSGTATDNLAIQSLFVNGTSTPVVDGTFSHAVTLTEGVSLLIVVAIDLAGNSTSTVMTVTLDTTPPLIRPILSPLSKANGWNNTDVTVFFAAIDSLSSIAHVTPPVLVTQEGEGHIIVGTATDLAGNSTSTSVIINIDKTPPQVTALVTPLPNAAGWNNADTTVTFTAQDSLSGVGNVTLPVTVSIEGTQLITRTGNRSGWEHWIGFHDCSS